MCCRCNYNTVILHFPTPEHKESSPRSPLFKGVFSSRSSDRDSQRRPISPPRPHRQSLQNRAKSTTQSGRLRFKHHNPTRSTGHRARSRRRYHPMEAGITAPAGDFRPIHRSRPHLTYGDASRVPAPKGGPGFGRPNHQPDGSRRRQLRLDGSPVGAHLACCDIGHNASKIGPNTSNGSPSPARRGDRPISRRPLR